MRTVPVAINLPRDVYLALLDRADIEGVQVHHLIEHAVTESVRKRRRSKITQAMSEAIWHMSKAGRSDAWIARKLGVGQVTVSTHRAALGLPSNFRSPNPKAANE